MSSRPIWSGFLRFSLVSVPVRAFGVAEAGGGGIHFNQLHAECHSRVQYIKTCPIHGELRPEDIVSGYQWSKGQYVVVDPDEIDKLRTPSEKAIDIRAFIPPDRIDARYYAGKNWYILPDGPAALRPYALLHRTMDEQNVAAFAQIVTGGREQLLLLRPVSGILIGTYVNFAEDVKSMDEFRPQAPKVDVSPDELKLSKAFAEQMADRDFDLSQYKDDFEAKVRQMIEAKVNGQEVVAAPAVEEQPAVVNLMESLKESLARAQRAAKSAKPPRLAAPSAGHERRARRRKSS